MTANLPVLVRAPHHWGRTLKSATGAMMAMTLLGLSTAPAQAQDDTSVRVKKLEAEVRALQRKVFPGPDGKFFEPQITAQGTTTTTAPPPSTGAVTDILARLDALETSLARMTAQTEETANRTRQLETRLAALEGTQTSSEPTAGGTSAVNANTAAMTGGSVPRAATAPSADRIAAVRAIEKPNSGDAGEDNYLYGFRLWESKFYPEAQQQLQLTTEKYPKHKRASYARNLLGRAYLDDGKPGTAAKTFLANYQADKSGDRAPDSLLYLAVAMTDLKETQRACVALQEFSEAYPQESVGRLATQYGRAKSGVKCN